MLRWHPHPTPVSAACSLSAPSHAGALFSAPGDSSPSGPASAISLVPRRQVWTGATDGTTCRDRIGRMDGTAPTGAARLSAAAPNGGAACGIFFFSPSVVPEAGLHPPLWAQNRMGGCVAAGKLVDSPAVLFLPVHVYVELPWIRGARCGISRANGLSASIAEPGLTKREGRAARGRHRARPKPAIVARSQSRDFFGLDGRLPESGLRAAVPSHTAIWSEPGGSARSTAARHVEVTLADVGYRHPTHAHAIFEWTSEG